MLDGFVVPHAHFRVFHGNAAAESAGRAVSTDQLALLFQPWRAEAVPTDLHLREFAQLEAQLKALQQQQQQQQQQTAAAGAPTSRLVGVAQAAALAECLSFYARLMTPESFTWPDFLTIVAGKLTEQFVASESDLVRQAILDVFRGSRAHLARVTDAAKIATLVRGLLRQDGDALSTVWALQIVAAMPSLAVDDSSIRGSVLRSLVADDAVEKQAAVEAARAILPLSADFRQAVFAVVAAANSPMLVSLMPLAFDKGDLQAAEQAWNFCASAFHNQVGDVDALRCLRAAGKIAASQPETMLARHLQLVLYVVTQDPRRLLVSNVWSTCSAAIGLVKEKGLQAQFFDVVSLQLQPGSPRDGSASAIRALSCFSTAQGDIPTELVDSSRQAASASALHQRLFLQLLAHCAHEQLCAITHSSQDHGIESFTHLNALIQRLSPRQFARDRRVWLAAAAHVKDLASTFPQQIGNYVGECHVQLLGVAQRKNLDTMEAALWKSLSYVAPYCPQVLGRNGELLVSNKTFALDAKTKQAIAVCLVAASSVCNVERHDQYVSQCLLLTCDSDSDRYTVAQVAMCHGSSRLAARLLKPIADSVDNELFGSWLRALIAISDASVRIGSDQVVSIDAHSRLAEGKALLQAQASAHSGFEFQVAFIDARMRFMELMLQAQQYAGEIAHTGRSCGTREHRLSEAFRDSAAQFLAIRSKMLCATGGDRDMLNYHARVSLLVADAAAQFLVPDQHKQSEQPRFSPSGASLAARFEELSSLEHDVQDKSSRLRSLDAARQPLVGATVFVQLLQVACTLPLLIPRQFFRSQARPSERLRCNMQFLTQAEATSAPSKPRTRSQLGVAVGTEFRSSLQGTIAFPRASTIRSMVSAVRVAISLAVEKTDAGTVDGNAQQVCELTIPLAVPELSHDSATTEWTFVPIDAPIVVPGEVLKSKGTYVVQAAASIVDSNGESWALALTGGRRGIIVY